MVVPLYTLLLYILFIYPFELYRNCTICSIPQNPRESKVFNGTDMEQIQKKMTAPVLEHRSGCEYHRGKAHNDTHTMLL